MGVKGGPVARVWLLNTGVLFFALLLLFRLGHVQIVQGEAYREKAEQQYTSPSSGAFDRGSIFFTERTGRTISAATVVPDYTFAIDPTRVKDAQALAAKVSTVITIDQNDFITHATRVNDRYEEIAKHLTEKEADALRALGEKAIVLSKDKKRYYPGESTAAHVLGFVGSGESGMSGKYGLERYYEETLARSQSDIQTNFFATLFLKAGSAVRAGQVREGDLVTTIEPTVQGFLERVITDDILKKYSARQASGIIMDPKTGAIYAMATAPTFDPNAFSKERDVGVFVNPLVEGIYEMGSIIKPLTMAAGLDAGVVTANTTYDDKGFLVIDRKRIANYDGKARGVVPMQKVLNDSLNTGTVFVSERLGKDRFRAYFKAFGLGEETGIDLPNEAAGILRNIETNRNIEYATASFGQGISMTPIATVRALAALGNGGVLVTPHVVRSVDYGFGSNHDFVPSGERRVIKKETSREISRMLTAVVDDALLGGSLKMEHYRIAAKTGTAQTVEEGGYSKENYLHTFFGYFPAYDPQFIVFLAVKNPRGEQYASHTLSHPFMQIAKFLINYYEVPPDR